MQNKTVGNLDQSIGLLPCVRFKHVPRAFLVLINAMLEAEEKFHFEAYVTGASYEDYPKGGLHDWGYAWDIRVHDVIDRIEYVCFLLTYLKSIDERFRIVYGDVDHTDHIHVEYRVVDSD